MKLTDVNVLQNIVKSDRYDKHEPECSLEELEWRQAVVEDFKNHRAQLKFFRQFTIIEFGVWIMLLILLYRRLP